jgi:cell division protein FtsB
MVGLKVSRSSVDSVRHEFVEQRARQKRLAQDVETVNRRAEKLNSEMSDALSFQARMD